MTKKMDRIAAQGWAELRREQAQRDGDAKRLAADLEALRTLRKHLISNPRGQASDALVSAIDDYAGHLTGSREALWSKDSRQINP